MLNVALVLGLVAFATSARAAMPDQITKHVPSGKTTVVRLYKQATRSCESVSGTATLVSKPKHGTVANRLEPTTFGESHSSSRCHGKPTLGFVVTYTSAPGFRGLDHFILEVRLPSIGLHRLDAFSIIVE